MTEFHESHAVEVYVSGHVSYDPILNGIPAGWRAAKIVRMAPDGGAIFNPVYEVQFPDGTSAVFDAEHIRAVSL